MFRFNFQTANFAEENSNSVEMANKISSEQPCDEIIISDVNINCDFEPILIGDTKFLLKDLRSINKSENENFMASFKDCDVIPTVYEGGLKVWECTYDLLLFLMKNKLSFEGKIVLDLGCGCGLLGIFAALNGAKMVHFQDFNADVLRNFTIPNVQRNNIKSETKFISGDWKNFSNSTAITDTSYDYILSSETLYNINSYEKLSKLFIQKLHQNGEIFIASKSYYFGVGGSVRQFQEFLNKTGTFSYNTVWKTTEGVQREILSVKRARP